MDQKPTHQSESCLPEPVYAGFWIRSVASIIDSILLLFLIIPLMIGVSGMDSLMTEQADRAIGGFFITWGIPAFVVIVFWMYRSATPGKMMVHVKIADAETGGDATTRQLIGRYVAYFVSTISLMLGFLWVAFDKRKQGWHDKLAGTVVIKT